jgi:hypothetical protein
MKRPDTFREVAEVTSADSITSLSCSDALRQRGRKVSLFTPAVLLTHGHFDRDPVIEFDARFPAASRDLRPFCIDLTGDREFFFQGLGLCPAPGTVTPVNWDKRLYVIDHSRAEECFAFLSGISYSSPKHGIYGATFAYGLDIDDPTSKKGERLLLTALGVILDQAGKQSIIFLAPNANGCPVLKQYPLHDGRLPPVLRGQALFTSFDGEDPINMRDE